jgi:hypothetical protein
MRKVENLSLFWSWTLGEVSTPDGGWSIWVLAAWRLLQETEAGIFRGPEQAEFGRFGNFGDTSGTGENGKNSKTSATPKIFENFGNSANPKNFSNLGKTSLTSKKTSVARKTPLVTRMRTIR